MNTVERSKSGERVLQIEARGVLVTVWRTVQAAGLGARWITDAVDLRTGHDVERYSHHATRERASRAASRLISKYRRAAI